MLEEEEEDEKLVEMLQNKLNKRQYEEQDEGDSLMKDVDKPTKSPKKRKTKTKDQDGDQLVNAGVFDLTNVRKRKRKVKN